MEQTLPEALLLLAWKRGRPLPLASVGIQVSCALLLELSLRGRIALGDPVVVLQPVPTRNEALDEALHELITSKRAGTLDWVRGFGILAAQGARRRLEAAGALPEAELPAGVRAREQLEAELREILFAGAAPALRALHLIAVQHTFGAEAALWGSEADPAKERAEALLRRDALVAAIGAPAADALAQVLASARLIVNS